MRNFLKDHDVRRVMNSVAAGTSDQNSSSVRMDEGRSITFLLLIGALTAGQVTQIKAQQSSDDGVVDDWTDIAGSLVGPFADADGNKMLALEIFKPMKEYVRLVVDRGTANAVIDGVIAVISGPRKSPPTQHTTLKALKVLNSPAEGTA